MSRSSVRQQPSMRQINTQSTVISRDQFDQFLKTLPAEQSHELQQLVKTHALIHYDPSRKVYHGTDKIMRDLMYLLQTADEQDITSLEISASFSNQSQTIAKQIIFFHAPLFELPTYKATRGELYSVKTVAHNVFQMIYEQKQVVFDNRRNQPSENHIYISNRCNNNKNIFMIFQKVNEILELQALIDREIMIEDIHTTIERMQNEGGKMFETQIIEDRKLYWFKRTSKEDWLKFINNINKFFASTDIILMKFRHFSELLQHKNYFNQPVRVAIDDSELVINTQRVAQFRVLQNNKQTMYRVQRLATELLERGSKHLKLKNYLIDQISCFNYYLLQARGANELFVVRPSPEGKKAYIYFVFYRKYMLIETNKQSNTVQLKEVSIAEEITNKYYLIALEKMHKHAVINQLPFFLVYNQAANIDQTSLSQLTSQSQGDFTHLLAYQYLLRTPKYKVDCNPIMHKTYLSNKYEKNFKLVFNKTSPIYSLMGQTQAEENLIRRRIIKDKVEKGCMQAPAHFSREFVRKCLEQMRNK